MADVYDVAEHILQQQGSMSAMKLQKLVYYSQAWHAVWRDARLFQNRIEAWKDGPVCPDLWREHANCFLVERIARGDPDELHDRQMRSIGKVLKFYGKRSAQWLSDLTHMEDPWKNARRGIPEGQSSSNEITVAAMARYYSSL